MTKKVVKLFLVVLFLWIVGGQVCTVQGGINDGLVAYWPLDHDFSDATGNGHDASKVFGDPEFIMDAEHGMVLYVDGTDDRAQIDDKPDLNYSAAESMTLTAWTKFDAPGPGGWKGIVVKGRTGPNGDNGYIDRLYGFWVRSDGKQFNCNSGGMNASQPGANDGQWHHLAFVQDADAGSSFWYIDGQLVATSGVDTCDTTGRPFFIGASGNDLLPFEIYAGWIDEVRIYNRALSLDEVTAVMSYSAYLANTPTPADNQENVDPDADLSWTAPDPAVISNPTYTLYFGEDPNAGLNPSFDMGTATSYDPGTLNYGTTYYWRVDVTDPNEGGAPIIYQGLTWQFTTRPQTPIFSVQPQMQLLAAGETANFSAEVESDTGASFQWYRFDPNTMEETMLSDSDPDISGATTRNLTIANVALADEDEYFLRATNSAGSSDSDHASLHIKRMIAYWPLDGDTLDATGNGNDAERRVSDASKPLPQFIDGVPYLGGQALEFDNPSSAVTQYAYAGDIRPGQITGQMTISLWADWYGTNGDWQGIIAKRNAWAPDQMMWQLEVHVDGRGANFARNGAGSTPYAPLPVNEWSYLTVTYDGDTTASIYLNGELIGSTNNFTYGSGVDSNFGFGTDNINADGIANQGFNGALDDIRIYNYSWTPIEVAQFYTGISGTTVCLDKNMPTDFNGDCRVDLADFQIFAQTWMDCNIVPTCLP